MVELLNVGSDVFVLIVFYFTFKGAKVGDKTFLVLILASIFAL